MKQTITQIDALVRQRLGELPESPPSTSGWQRLSAALDADPDHQLATTLAGLSPVATSSASGWEALERKLDPLAPADAILATALEGLQPTEVKGWDILEKQLDEEAATAVDAVVVDRLARNVGGVSSGWAALAARLELIGQRRGMIAAGKITEFSLLLSLLLLFVRFGTTLPPTAATPEIPIAEQEQIDVATSTPVLAAVLPAPNANLPVAEEVVLIPETTPSTTAKVTRVAPNSSPRRKAVAPILALAPATAGEETVRIPTPNVVIEEEKELISVEAIPGGKGEVERSTILPHPALSLPAITKEVPMRYHANFFMSPFDVNQVITPATQIGDFDISGDSRITQGFSAGALLDISQGKNGLQIGAIYARRSYIPTALKWYLQEEYPIIEPVKGYSRFRFETISFPVSFKRTVVDAPRWKIGVRVGMTMSVIAKSDFIIPTQDQQDLIDGLNGRLDRLNQAQVAGGGAGRSASLSKSRKLTNPEPGWLEGGSMLENASFYLGGGVTFERVISPRWSIYASPSFSRAVFLNPEEGLGPYNDRIHLGSLRFGGRYLLNNK
ncbi:MAG: hypothetical protein AAGA62_02775 [Bacteroidota bacterium]